MAYYTALITAWNGATQPPTGVTGSGLLGGDTTAQKITKVNAWTITGTVPTCSTSLVRSFSIALTLASSTR